MQKKELKTKKVKSSQKTKEKEVVKKTSPLEISVFNLKGEEESKINLPKEIFTAKSNLKSIAQYIRIYLANQRQGTASTKTRGEVNGSTKKIYRQKGTGRARHGDIKAPIFVGGGVVGGPKPRDYRLSFPKKQKKQVLFSVLTYQLKAGNIFALTKDALQVNPKTKVISDFLKKMKIYSQKIIFVLPKMEKNPFVLASRNLPKISFSDPQSLNAFKLLNNEKIIFIESSLPILEEHFLKN